MHTLLRVFHLVPAAILIGGPVAQYTGVMTYGQVGDIVCLNKFINMVAPSFPLFPDMPDEDSFVCFFLNLSLVVGVAYFKVALTGEEQLARNFCLTRFLIGVLNIICFFTGKASGAFAWIGCIETSTAILGFANLGFKSAEARGQQELKDPLLAGTTNQM